MLNRNLIYQSLVGLLVVLTVCACSQRATKSVQQNENGSQQHQEAKSGLLIDHGSYRGTEFTDSLGNQYNLRVNPITITNDSIIPIHVQLAFSKEYNYPNGYGDGPFKVFPLPKEWARNRTTDDMFELMWVEFENHVDNPLMSKTIGPGEKLVIAIGTLYPIPKETLWVVPHELFTYSDGSTFPDCELHKKENQSLFPFAVGAEIEFGLQLHMDAGCRIIPCGQISYPEP